MAKNHTSYQGYINHNGLYRAADKRTLKPKLPSGVYTVTKDIAGQTYFKEIESTHDELVHLPDPAYERVTNEMNHFLKPETKEKFAQLGYLYKRSSLLYGLPGTGKTSIVNRITENIINTHGIVLMNPNPGYLIAALEILKELQPESTVLVVFEELDQLLYDYESELLNILDGEIQKENVIYVATTNFIHKVPPRLMRPGRFSSIIEVGYPNVEARKAYLNTKIDSVRADNIAENSEGLSIDELKEVVQSVECFNYDSKEVISRIRKTKELAGKDNRDQDDEAAYLYEPEQVDRREAMKF